MKHILLRSITVFMLLVLPLQTAQGAFSDAGTSQYVDSINALQARGLVEGYAGNTFKPFQNINRAEFLKLTLAATNISTADTPGNCFPDVHTEWFAPYVCKAKQMGLVKGYQDGKFKAGQTINIVEAFAMVSKAFDLSIKAPAEGEEWFGPLVTFFHESTLFSRYAYNPGRAFKREEMAFLLNALLLSKEGTKSLTLVRDVGSAGCGKAAPTTPPTSFSVNGGERTAITYIPKSYDPTKPISIVFAFHGRTNSNERVRSYYGVERASSGNAIMVYPAGNKTGSTYNWSNSYPFFDEMVRVFKNSYCINVDEIYVVGHSLGAWFTNDLGCVRGDVIRAIGSLGGGRNERNCSGPTAAMLLHNPKDSLAPFSGGEAARDKFLTQNACSKNTVPVPDPEWGHCIEYTGCQDGAPVIWCPHTVDTESDGTYYTHVWPRGTGQVLWDFFRILK